MSDIVISVFSGGNERLIFGCLLAFTVLVLSRGIIPSLGDLLAKWRSRDATAIVGARFERPQVLGERSTEWPGPTGRILLEVRNVEMRFGGVRALDSCSIKVEEGTITALIGPNGSGKTRFSNIDGTMRPDGGEVWVDGKRIDGRPPWERAHRGMGRTFQITRLFRELTVLENVVAPLGSFSWLLRVVGGLIAPRKGEVTFADEPIGGPDAAEVLALGIVQVPQSHGLFPNLTVRENLLMGGYLVRRQRALVRDRYRGLAESIALMIEAGKTILVVEQNIRFGLRLATHGVVMESGRVLLAGTAREALETPDMADPFFGGSADADARKAAAAASAASESEV